MRQVTVLDSGFASQLGTYVDKPIDGTPLWSAGFLASHPQACVNTHLDFLRAGSHAISTNTYQASIEGFKKHLGLSEQASCKLIQSAVQLARQAVEMYIEESSTGPASKEVRKPLIVGSIGPYGAILNDGSEYSGNYVENMTKKELMDWHRPRMQILKDAGVDLFAMETIPAQLEGEALVELLKEMAPIRAWLSFSCKDEQHTSHGEKFSNTVRACWELNSSQLVAIGANCLNPKYVTPLFKNINADSSKGGIPLVVYPNNGQIYDAKSGWSEGGDCHPIEKYVHEWLDLGVQYIGGCCRTYPELISKLCTEVHKWTQSSSGTTQ